MNLQPCDQYHTDQGEVILDFGTSTTASSLVTYNDMHQALMSIDDAPPFTLVLSSQIRKQIDVGLDLLQVTSHVHWTCEDVNATSVAHHEEMWCPIHKWRWFGQRCMRQLHCACWKYLVTETKFKPPDRPKSHITQEKLRWCSYGSATYSQDDQGDSLCQRILEAETKHKPPDTPLCLPKESTNCRVSEDHRVISHNHLHSIKSTFLVVETKYRPPDVTHQRYM